jgi:Domain of unknown function (DUF6362)
MLSAGRALLGSHPAPEARVLMSPEQLRDRFLDAADTLRRLPKPKEFKGSSLQSPWPDTIKEWLAYASSETHVKRAAPSPEAITRLDEVLGWLHELTPDQRMIIWARAEGITWRRIEFLDRQVRRGRGRQDRQLRNIRDDGEARILSRINGTPSRMRLNLAG